jgi:hypothetical protein
MVRGCVGGGRLLWRGAVVVSANNVCGSSQNPENLQLTDPQQRAPTPPNQPPRLPPPRLVQRQRDVIPGQDPRRPRRQPGRAARAAVVAGHRARAHARQAHAHHAVRGAAAAPRSAARRNGRPAAPAGPVPRPARPQLPTAAPPRHQPPPRPAADRLPTASPTADNRLPTAADPLPPSHESDLKDNVYWLGLLTHLQARGGCCSPAAAGPAARCPRPERASPPLAMPLADHARPRTLQTHLNRQALTPHTHARTHAQTHTRTPPPPPTPAVRRRAVQARRVPAGPAGHVRGRHGGRHIRGLRLPRAGRGAGGDSGV